MFHLNSQLIKHATHGFVMTSPITLIYAVNAFHAGWRFLSDQLHLVT